MRAGTRTLMNILSLSIMITVMFKGLHCLKVNIIAVMMDDNPVYGYPAQGPAYDVAFQLAVKKYPISFHNASSTIIHKPGMRNCADAAAIMPIAAAEAQTLIERLEGFTVLIVTGCSLEALALGDFAREWNVPLMSTLGTDRLLSDDKRYPTTVSFGPSDYAEIVKAILALLNRFSWRTISLLCDDLTDMPANGVFALSTCRNFVSILAQEQYRYMSVNLQRFDSKGNHTADHTYLTVLQMARNVSRVILVMTDPRRLRALLVIAQQMNMTSGDYIYIAPVPTKVPGGGETTWQAFDDDDQAVLTAFESLIFVNNPNPNWTDIEDLLAEIANRSALVYNHTLSEDQYLNNLAIMAFETMSCLADVLNESFTDLNQIDGRGFRQKLLNRTFKMPSQPVSIRSNGLRVSDVVFSRLNKTSQNMEDTWRYFSVQESLLEISLLGRIWKGGHGPPPDVPLCGFKNDRCHSSDFGPNSSLAIASYSVLAVLFALALTIWQLKSRNNSEESHIWWIIDDERFLTKLRISSLPGRSAVGYNRWY